MVYQLPVLPPDLAVGEGWAPRESFSPSQLQTYAAKDGCKRKWAWGSCFGVWGVKKSIAQLLGSLIHGSLEHYMKGGTVYDLVAPEKYAGQPMIERLRLDERTLKEFAGVDPGKLAELAEEAPKRALAGLHLLPDTQDPLVEKREVERWINIDTKRVIGGIQPLKIPGKIDLSVRRAGVWYLYDHKSTKGRGRDPWCYVKTPDELRKDPQVIFYGLDVMLRHGIDSLWIRWIYYLTDTKSHPLAKNVDVELKLVDVLHEAYQWLLVANEMREWIRKALRGELSPYDVPANEEACDAYGGCNYSYTKGGPCMPAGEVKLGDMILTGDKPEKEPEPMTATAQSSLAQQLAAVQGMLPPQAPMIPANPLVPPEAHGVVPTAAAVAAAPAQTVAVAPALPPGWHYGPNNVPRADAPAGCQYNAAGVLELIPAAPPAAPAGFQYNAVGQLEPIPSPVAAPPPLPPAIVAPVAATADLAAPVPVPAQPEKAKGGRKKGSKNKPAEASAGTITVDPLDEDDLVERLLTAAFNAPDNHPLKQLTIAQINAVREALEAA